MGEASRSGRRAASPPGTGLRRLLWLPLLILVLLTLLPPPFIARLDLFAYDLLAHRLGARLLPQQAVVIAIDDASLQQFGRWPWSRQRYADLLEKLDGAPSGPVALAILLDAAGDPAGDEALGDQLAQHKPVFFPVLPALAPDGRSMQALRTLAAWRPSITEGHADVEIDPDGQTRRLFLEAGIAGQRWPALAWAVIGQRSPTFDPPAQRAAPADDSARWQRDQELLLRNDLIGDIPLLPYASVMDAAFPIETLRGKTIFVGVTASGASGSLAMANSRNGRLVPAVEYHARVFEALQAGAVLTPAGRPVALVIGLLLVGAALGLSRRMSHHWSLTLLALALLPAVASFALLHLADLWMPPVAASLALLVLALHLVWRRISDFEEAHFLFRRRTGITMESIADGVIVIDSERRIEQANSVSARLLGQTPDNLQGQPCDSVLGMAEPLLAGIERCLAEGQPVLLDEALTLPVTPPCTVRVSIGPIHSRGKRSRGAVLVLSDITPLVLAEHRLKYQATHDPLTGLPNRTLIQDRLQQLLAGMQRRHSGVVVLFLDLDRFKRINDGAGHPIGDIVLRTISNRLRNVCRAEDTVGRWGGDEFVIVLAGDDALDHGQPVARKLIAEIGETITIDGANYKLGASIGIALAPSDADRATELIRLADLAMYRAKVAGGDRFAFASQDLNRASSQRLAIETDLRKALQRGEFEIHYQPQVSIDRHRLTGLEALIRWNRPGFGQIPPDQFIPIAEESGLINEIGAWVLDTVGRQIRDWRLEQANLVPVAINVSPRQCQDLILVEQVRDLLTRYDIPASLIEIEITETAAVQNLEHMARLLGDLASLGVKLAIDDFGTGYSSLAHLKSLPINVLKIDKSFVSGTVDSHEDRSISRATIALAHSLGMTVVAEGVENEQQHAFLTGEACDVAQGFLFSRPMPATDTLRLLQQDGDQPPDFSI